jgi:hypothetical protein
MSHLRSPRHVFLFISVTLLLLGIGRYAHGENSPQMRPALLARDAKALINVIDTEKLMKNGQKDATIRFSCVVGSGGWCSEMATYGGTPGSELLAKEVLRHSESEHPGFVPAVYHGQTHPALISGTVVFFIKENKPHLRIYLSEEPDHIAQGDNFVAPQMTYVKGQTFRGFKMPGRGVGSSALVVLRVSIDATGKVTAAKVALEKPEGRGFGAQILGRIGEVIFIPAYLNGQPVDSTTTFPIIYKSGGGGQHWKTG